MSIRAKLLQLRAAARSLNAAPSPSACLRQVLEGMPYDQIFFRELADPAWLPILIEAGLFRNLPTGIPTPDGGRRFPWYGPLLGVVKLAKLVPDEVTALLESLDIPENPAIQDQILQIIAAMDDVSFASRLTPVLRVILSHTNTSNWLRLDDILVKWVSRGAHDASIAILDACFKKALEESSNGSNRHDNTRLNEIDRNVVAKLAEIRPLEIARLLRDVLVSWAESERQRIRKTEGYYSPEYNPDNDPNHDFPATYWLEDFGSRTLGGHDVESTVAHRLYFIGQHLYASNDSAKIAEFDAMLRENQWLLFRRLRWKLYADFPDRTVPLAKSDVLERIPRLGHRSAYHSHEMALMLEAHANANGHLFLQANEVSDFANAVFTGPIQDDGKTVDIDLRDRFYRIQLHPIRTLLEGEVKEKFDELSKGHAQLSSSTYMPFSGSGIVRNIGQVPPKQAEQMPTMTDSELWLFLNSWKPEKRDSFDDWNQESDFALGEVFSNLLESSPARFPSESKWWTNIHRPAPLFVPLERFTKRLEAATKSEEQDSSLKISVDWSTWFGVAEWIVELRHRHSEELLTWNWPAIIVAKFLEATTKVFTELPAIHRVQTGILLKRLFEAPDPWLDEREESRTDGWLTAAINSVSGNALEGLLNLALAQMREPTTAAIEPWIFDLIASHLSDPSSSPGIFAIMGSRLRFVLFLFSDKFATHPKLLLPEDRIEQRTAFLLSHIQFDNPVANALKVLPELPMAALDCLRQINKDEQKSRDGRNDFGRRLGTHLAFYYWNDLFADRTTATQILDRFFSEARPEDRAATIGEIAGIFERALSEVEQGLCSKAMELWDRRFSQIELAIYRSVFSDTQFEGELGRFIEWLECECFPFSWRYDRVLHAIGKLKASPNIYGLIEALDRFTSSGERIDESIAILHALIHKISDESRWSFHGKDLNPLLERGFSAVNVKTRELTQAIQDALLSQGFFDCLEISPRE